MPSPSDMDGNQRTYQVHAFVAAHSPSRTPCMCCPRGGLPTLRHNEVRDVIAELLKEVCSGVTIEPILLPLSGEDFQSASTITSLSRRMALGLGERQRFFSFLMYRDACSTRVLPLIETKLLLQLGKRLQRSEHFCPLVFSTQGYAGPECDSYTVLKRLGGLLSEGVNRPYSSVMSDVRWRLSFTLLGAAIMKCSVILPSSNT